MFNFPSTSNNSFGQSNLFGQQKQQATNPFAPQHQTTSPSTSTFNPSGFSFSQSSTPFGSNLSRQQTSAFGSPSVFGATQPQGFSTFGQSSSFGTRNLFPKPFAKERKTYHSVNCSPELRNRPLIELQYEDFMNRAVSTDSSGIGQTDTSKPIPLGTSKSGFPSTPSSNTFGSGFSSGFGSAPLFGQSSNLFGSKPTTNTFAQPTSSNPFGTKPQQTGFSAFGQSNTASPTSSLFGSSTLTKPQTTTPFGSVSNSFATVKPATNAFGSANNASPTPFSFSTTNNSASNLFGAAKTNAPVSSNPFGSPSPSPFSFSSTNTSTPNPFSSTPTNSLSNPFGKTTNNTPTNPFGSTNNNTVTNPFGSTANTAANLFGTTPSKPLGSSLFGTSATQTQGTSNLFGSSFPNITQNAPPVQPSPLENPYRVDLSLARYISEVPKKAQIRSDLLNPKRLRDMYKRHINASFSNESIEALYGVVGNSVDKSYQRKLALRKASRKENRSVLFDVSKDFQENKQFSFSKNVSKLSENKSAEKDSLSSFYELTKKPVDYRNIRIRGLNKSLFESSTQTTFVKSRLLVTPELKNCYNKKTDTLVVEDKNFGKIEWLESVDLEGVVFDKLLKFSAGELEVFKAEEFGFAKVDKKVRVTLYNCWPFNKFTGKRSRTNKKETLDKYEDTLKTFLRNKKGARFVMFDRATGQFCFEVNSLSDFVDWN